MDHYGREPFGELRADLRVGLAVANLRSVHTKRRLRAVDFMPRFNEPKQTPEEAAQVFHMAALAAQGARK